MNIILLSKRSGSSGCIQLGRSWLVSLGAGLLVLLPLLALVGGYYLGSARVAAAPDQTTAEMRAELDAYRARVEETKRTAQENMDALARRLGQLQARVIRLDALGERLVKMADLDKGEFDFDAVPAQGGPESPGEQSVSTPDFMQALQELSTQLEDRSRQLGVLESMLMTRNLQAEVMPAGRPIEHGWLSSYFGRRTDPFTGKMAYHEGMDFAGKLGSDVLAVASGVVTWAGKRSGYGNLVEINHGNGYATRYGHNKEILVKLGDTVKKGQVIAHMGSTGRSTGPHVHFEVLRNGKPVNPKRYVNAGR